MNKMGEDLIRDRVDEEYGEALKNKGMSWVVQLLKDHGFPDTRIESLVKEHGLYGEFSNVHAETFVKGEIEYWKSQSSPASLERDLARETDFTKASTVDEALEIGNNCLAVSRAQEIMKEIDKWCKFKIQLDNNVPLDELDGVIKQMQAERAKSIAEHTKSLESGDPHQVKIAAVALAFNAKNYLALQKVRNEIEPRLSFNQTAAAFAHQEDSNYDT